MAKSNRLPGLDGLRGLCALLIVLGHTVASFIVFTPRAPGIITKDTHAHWYHVIFAVDIFFVISGFIITHILLREEELTGRINIKEFYVRRSLRILPPAYAYLCVVFILGWAGVLVAPFWEIIQATLFATNLKVGESWFIGHYWSLSIEEQFYLVWPVMFLILSKRWRLPFALTACALAPIYRHITLKMLSPAFILWNRTDRRYDALMTGVALALLWSLPHIRALVYRFCNGYAFMAAVAFICLTLPLQSKIPAKMQLFLPTARYWSVAVIIIVLITKGSRVASLFFDNKLMIWLGKISYSLYLWQQFATFYPWMDGVKGMILSVVLALLFASLSYYFIELPALRIRGKMKTEPINDIEAKIIAA